VRRDVFACRGPGAAVLELLACKEQTVLILEDGLAVGLVVVGLVVVGVGVVCN